MRKKHVMIHTGCLVLVLLGLIFGLLVSISSCQIMNQDTATVVVTGKTRIHSGDTGKYLIFTEDETFENTDNLFARKFNSSDVYGKIQSGKTYRFRVGGKRIPILSMYRNILSIE